MTDLLAIADRQYSSWSLRGWLLYAAFDIPVKTVHATMRTPGFGEMLAGFGAARTVPAMRYDDVVLWDSVAILETLVERFPEAGHLPKAPAARGLARALVAEMHSGFSALRNAFPMNLGRAYRDVPVSDEVRADVDRIVTLWGMAREMAAEGPWLFGGYSAADAFFAPVAMRLASYDVALPEAAQAYVAAHLHHGPLRRWRAMGLSEGTTQAHYEFDFADRPWPGPTPLAAKAVTGETALNPTCPYSGKPVAGNSLARIDGLVVGFCNPFCRDKSVVDAEAWPDLVALLNSLRG